MKELFGSPGRKSGLILRIGQCVFAAASIVVMTSANSFSTITAFCYLIASMGLQALWSFGLVCLDIHALRFNKDLRTNVIVSLFVVGDWDRLLNNWLRDIILIVAYFDLAYRLPDNARCAQVTATLSLAAACSSAGVMVLFTKDTNICNTDIHLSCNIYQISIAFSFASWFLLATSSYIMFCLVASI